jgi:P27 family predicted phage terminase small subunit
VAWAEFRLSAEALEKDGRVVKSLTGGPRSHPAAAQLASAAKTLQQVGSLFGLNPAAAARMVATQAPGEGDALDLFLSGADTPPLKLADIVADLAGEEE